MRQDWEGGNMFRLFLHLILALFLLCTGVSDASAQLGNMGPPDLSLDGQNITAMEKMVDGVTKMTKIINDASKEMMKI